MQQPSQQQTEKRNRRLAEHMADACEEKRAEDVAILDLRTVCDFTDFFVIATAANRPQMKAIVRDVEKTMKAERTHLLNRDGVGEGRWVLLDYGDVVLHLFDETTREFYQLEHLWGDAERVR